jgi:hypothetical protein
MDKQEEIIKKLIQDTLIKSEGYMYWQIADKIYKNIKEYIKEEY